MSRGPWKSKPKFTPKLVIRQSTVKVEIEKEQFDTIRRNVKGAMDIVNQLQDSIFRDSAQCKDCYDKFGIMVGCRCEKDGNV